MKKIMAAVLLTLGLNTPALAEWQCNTSQCQAKLREAIQLTQNLINKLEQQKYKKATKPNRNKGAKKKPYRGVKKRKPSVRASQRTIKRSTSRASTRNLAVKQQVTIAHMRQQQLLLQQMRQNRQIDYNRAYCAVAGNCYIRLEKGLVIREFPQ